MGAARRRRCQQQKDLYPHSIMPQWSAVRTWSVKSEVFDVICGRITGGMHFRDSGVVGAEWVTSHGLQPTGQ